jgi:hypothetical protein
MRRRHFAVRKYLQNNGHTGFVYVLGTRNGGHHAWLRRGRLVVDITADQFEDQNRSVIVEIESKWHELFELDDDDKQHPSDFEKYNEAAAVQLRNTYRAIIRQLSDGGGSSPVLSPA